MKAETAFVARAVLGKVIWIAFAVLFFYSGLFFTEWLLETEKFAGGWRWILVAAFPFLVPGFFVVNRRYGCASGGCGAGSCKIAAGSHPGEDGASNHRMPLA